MICPMLTVGAMSTEAGVGALKTSRERGIDCLGEKCAWWTGNEPIIKDGQITDVYNTAQCAIKRIAER